ncbi:MAG: LPS-assembly protein LptD [Rhodobacteraceae bacterium]|nr:LPS-assembly protein LptD [Paracoccaceae bacterium]
MRALFLILMLLLPAMGHAQGAATLVADSITVTDDRLIASGNVEAFYGGVRLSAARITYERSTDRLIIDGPFFIVTPNGDILTAEQAQLDPRLQNGLLRGARLVLNQQLQLAANRIDRVDGRYSQLTRAAVTSCSICADRPPLWEIRAERVVHDEQAQQLWFENAQFLVRGVPVFWLPRMRLPDPTLARATGFLIPNIRSSDRLGLGIKLPYFITLGENRDLTLTPYVSVETRTLEARYRQAFMTGQLALNGAVSRDTLLPDETRGYLFGQGDFVLPGNISLHIGLQSVSDKTYLADYGISRADRLHSYIAAEHIGQNSLTYGDLSHYRTLRTDIAQNALPPVVLSFAAEHRFAPRLLGGTVTLGGSLDAFLRPDDGAPAPVDQTRDLLRAGLSAGWQREWTFGPGLLAQAQLSANADYYRIEDDPAYPDPLLRLIPAAGLTLRWPLVRRAASGATDILEPVISIGWSHSYGATPPNEDATLVEFDEANLHALSRFPGHDASTDGWQTALGLSWTHIGASGTLARLTFGRIITAQAGDYSASSGLDGTASDYLLAGQLNLASGLSLTARSLFELGAGFGKTGAALSWSNPRIDLDAAYIWLPEDSAEGRYAPVSEWSVSAGYQISEHWNIRGDGRYDVANDRLDRTGIGFSWQNECVEVDFSFARRYSSATLETATNDFGFSVNLDGFSTGRSRPSATNSCAQ